LIKKNSCYYNNNSDTSIFNYIKLLKFAGPSISQKHAAQTLRKMKDEFDSPARDAVWLYLL